MKVRSTPARFCDRDHELFPAFHQARQRNGTPPVPSFYHIRAGRSVCRLLVDDFYVPPDVQARLEALYDAYVTWWMAPGNPARRRSARVVPYGFYDVVDLAVLREHADWWIDLLNEAAVFIYDPNKRSLTA